MRIRLACTEELDVLHAIVRDATRCMDEQGIPQWDEIYPNKAILTKDIERQEMHVIDPDGRVAGFIVINETQSPEYAAVEWSYPGRALVVHRLTIDPAYQRRGLATRLMDFAEETAAIQGYNCIRLDAFTRNPASFTLYENRGYRKAGIVRFRKGKFFCYEKAINAERVTESPNRAVHPIAHTTGSG
jgi:ribosomal protein S18 acetylase RimI-like enzyme